MKEWMSPDKARRHSAYSVGRPLAAFPTPERLSSSSSSPSTPQRKPSWQQSPTR
jgi:hypothetical protein